MSISLSSAAQSNSFLFIILQTVGRLYPQASFTSLHFIDQVMKTEGYNITQTCIQRTLYDLQKLKVGKVRALVPDLIGFEWHTMPLLAAEIMRQGGPIPETVWLKDVEDHDIRNDFTDPPTVTTIPLRGDVMCRISLPVNMTKAEAKEIYKHIKALAIDEGYEYDDEEDEEYDEDEDEDEEYDEDEDEEDEEYDEDEDEDEDEDDEFSDLLNDKN